MEILGKLLSDKTLKGAVLLLLLAMMLSLRYWATYYDEFSLDILNLTSPSDLLGLSIAKLRFTITALLVAAALLGGVLFQMWASPQSGGDAAIGFMLLVGFLVLFIVPGWAVDRAARNDARLVREGGESSWISTVTTPLDLTIENKDGSRSEPCRWIGATTSLVFTLCQGSSRRVVKRDEVRSLLFSPAKTTP